MNRIRTSAIVLTGLAGAVLSLTPAHASGPAEGEYVGGGYQCTQVRELGTKAVGRIDGMNAFTVRQYIGWCTSPTGPGWRNYATTYVWKQYRDTHRGWVAQAAIQATGNDWRGHVLGQPGQVSVTSIPVATTAVCTRGHGNVTTWATDDPGTSAFSSRVC